MPPLALGRSNPAIPAVGAVHGDAAMLAFSILGACVTGLLAQVRFPLWFTPVPVTGQVFGALLCGATLGCGYGALSQALYALAGAMGVPWFAGGMAGIAYLAGPTGGYVVGFMVAALFLGAAVERFRLADSLPGLLAILLCGVGIIYVFGVLHLMLALRWSFDAALALGVKPFIIFDVVKAGLVVGILRGISRRRD